MSNSSIHNTVACLFPKPSLSCVCASASVSEKARGRGCLTSSGLLVSSKNNSNKLKALFAVKGIKGEVSFIPVSVLKETLTKKERADERALSNMALKKKIPGFDFNEYALNEFEKYMEVSQKYNLVFRKSGAKGGRVTCKAPNRYSRSYQKKVKKSLAALWDYEFRKAVFLTLTLDPVKYSNQEEMWKDIKRQENRFLTVLFKKIGRRIDFLSVVEAQSNGNPHMHFLFFGVSRLMDWREIRRLWGVGGWWINSTKEGRKISNPVSYMSKYVLKTFTKTNDTNKPTQALLWLFHRRSYSTSKGLIPSLNSLKNTKEGEYELEGILVCSDEDLAIFTDTPQMFDVLVNGLG